MENIFKEGDFVEFKGMSVKVCGFICEINDNTINYVRESLTRWSADKEMVFRGIKITEDHFINKVKENAQKSRALQVPTTDEIKSALAIFKSNFDTDLTAIYSALNIK